MSNTTLHLTITRIDGPVFAGDVRSVVVPGVDGEMTILPHHTALISPLAVGRLIVTHTDGRAEEIPVTTGTLEISDNRATILL